MTFDVGSEVAGVRVDERTGQGGSSVVYRGTEISTGKSVAIKVLQDPGDPARRRMRREADLLARFEHDAVVRFHGLHEHGDDLILITDWVDGQSLRAKLNDPEFEGPAGALAMLQAIAAPLEHLHAADVVHRDVTPANIMCADDGSITLIDLGIGHDVGSSTLTNTNLLAGTPRYLAPEIIRGDSATSRSDQYSLAVVVYELAAGRSPFPQADEIATALHHQLNTIPAPLNELDPTVSAPFAAAVERALHKEPTDRFASVAEFAAAAGGALNAESLAAPVRARSSAVVAALIALVLAAAVVALVVLTRDGSGSAGSGATATIEVVEPVSNPVEGIWREGDASALTCNLLEGDDFENGSVPLDFFGDPPARERVVEAGGFDDSWALEVGIADGFGQYAEIVPVIGGESYRFQGWFATEGEVEVSRIGITAFDAASVQLEPESQVVLRSEPGFSQVELDLPPQTAFVLPWIYKDASPGVLLADELVFGLAGDCTAEIAGS